MSISLGFNTAIRALMAQQIAINTTAHNIANANTPGYSRQDVTMVTTDPYTVPGLTRPNIALQIGTGVTVSQIRRIRDEFLDRQFRLQNQGLGYWQTASEALKDLENLFNEPNGNGFSTLLAGFWNRWRDLTNDPSNKAVRLTLREEASAVASFFRSTFEQLSQRQRHLDEQILVNAQQVNSLATQIQSLNEQIVKIQAMGDQPNDLRDRRDLLLDEMSKLVRITAFEMPNGAVAVTIGGNQLVGDQYLNLIQIPAPVNANGFHDLVWSADGSAVNVLGGVLKAQLDMRDTAIPDLIDSLNQMAGELITQVNALHTTGFGLDGSTGNTFFTWSGVAGQEAATIDLDPAILADVASIAAAGGNPTTTSGPGDSDIAAQIAALQFALVLGGGTATIDDFYRGMIAELGTDGLEAQRQLDNQTLLVRHVDQGRQALSGVSLDQEATDMIRFQRAYQGAARMVTALDEMMDTIINRMGVVGR